MASLTVKNLRVAYGRVRAVEDASFALAPGQIVALLGPNGAGKSTTLLACAGQVAFAGEILLDQTPIRAAPETVARSVGLADQPPSLYDYLTVREQLDFVAQAYARPSAAADKLLADLGLASLASRLCRELSFGTRQRVGLACALLGQPKLLLLDETLGGLDPHALRRAEAAVRASAESGAAVLTSTHILPVAARLCQRALFMHAGRIVADVSGPFSPDELDALYQSHIPESATANQTQ